jgi:glycosyltransferase involved in cell wall biosynthesis
MISVCMATYNGSQFIGEQINSILVQLAPEDEIIVCDDCSIDNTISILSSYDDPRIKIYRNTVNLGHVKNFEKAIMLAKGDVVALSDQDDIWLPGRLEQMKNELDHPGVFLVATDFDLIDEFSKYIGKANWLDCRATTPIVRILKIFAGRMSYFGCTFLMKRELITQCLPFPDRIEAHDLWIALIANTAGKVHHLNRSSLSRRIHENNLTPPSRRSLVKIMYSKWVLFQAYCFWLSKYTAHKKSG